MAEAKWSVVFMFVFVIIAAVVGSLLRLPPQPPPIPDDIPDVDPEVEHFYNVSENGSDTESLEDGVGAGTNVTNLDPLWLLRISDAKDIDAKYFKIARVVNPLPEFKKAIGMSLYCKNKKNRYVDEHIDPSTEPGGHWYTTSFQPVLDIVEHVTSRQDMKEFKVRVYLAADLAENKSLLQQLDNSRIEIYIMAHASVGAQPGEMWKLLAWEDTALECACILDGLGEGDGPSEKVLACLYLQDLYNAYPNHALFKLYGEDLARFALVRPNQVGNKYPISSLMHAYFAHESTLTRTPDMPKKHWHAEGFDAQFLSHVILPALLKDGSVVSFGVKEVVDAYPDEEDLMMKKHPNNAVARVTTIHL
jgi:hypothetical protein